MTEEELLMWRRLLAELHPDRGGDEELFAFASNLRDEMKAGEHKPSTKQKVAVTTTGNVALDLWILYLRMWNG